MKVTKYKYLQISVCHQPATASLVKDKEVKSDEYL